ncbi:hypothetical protein B0J11DRAFT_544939 [Dendryphion nanum]|uniref:Uncharacterized protein n=1 Tax=Dendryphion nanum TaxID=256645 RepID=A0A9P9CZF2_9PLEO|nr:hypothetical protein B0J11DRAFT_544939 [Dendryphion nanum]
MNASIETPTMITRPSITINLTSAKPVFCQHYHNHYLSGTLSCYPRRIRGNHSDDPALRRDDSGNHPPPHHVILTVNGVHGFKIQNHTGLSECEFLDLPHIYPEWRWESIRSVNNFTPRSGFGTDFLVDVLTDPNPYGNYQPVYFESEYQPQDDQGRWPSHPGYGQGPSWSQDWN